MYKYVFLRTEIFLSVVQQHSFDMTTQGTHDTSTAVHCQKWHKYWSMWSDMTTQTPAQARHDCNSAAQDQTWLHEQ